MVGFPRSSVRPSMHHSVRTSQTSNLVKSPFQTVWFLGKTPPFLVPNRAFRHIEPLTLQNCTHAHLSNASINLFREAEFEEWEWSEAFNLKSHVFRKYFCRPDPTRPGHLHFTALYSLLSFTFLEAHVQAYFTVLCSVLRTTFKNTTFDHFWWRNSVAFFTK